MENPFYETGKYYGYPDCCIEYFTGRALMIRLLGRRVSLSEKQEEVNGGTGFIPCPSCAEKVTKDTLHTLIKDRKCPSPFPIDDMDTGKA